MTSLRAPPAFNRIDKGEAANEEVIAGVCNCRPMIASTLAARRDLHPNPKWPAMLARNFSRGFFDHSTLPTGFSTIRAGTAISRRFSGRRAVSQTPWRSSSVG
jgi:hypothetical protein